MKKFVILLISALVTFSFTEVFSQAWKKQRAEYVFGIGATSFFGELGGANREGTSGIGGFKDLDFQATRPTLHVGYSYNIIRQAAVKVGLTMGYISGNDKNTKEIFRNNRNLNFRSPLIELSGQFNYYFFTEIKGSRYRLKGVRGKINLNFATYVFAGISGFYFNPQGKYDGKWHNLKPLKTEGQGIIPTRDEYSLVQVAVPVGVGIKWKLNRTMTMGVEVGYRKTFTDYIDDVSLTYVDKNILPNQTSINLANPTNYSLPANHTAAGQQRGDPRSTDSYVFSLITFTKKIKKTNKWGLPKFRRK